MKLPYRQADDYAPLLVMIAIALFVVVLYVANKIWV
jgi:hypothetical protein